MIKKFVDSVNNSKVARKYRRMKRISVYKTMPIYEEVKTKANYTPSNIDKEFNETYKIIEKNTHVDRYRLWELWCLVEESKKIKNGAIIEVGSWRGGSGTLMAKKSQMIGIKNNVYLCDTFSGMVKTSEKDPQYKGGEHSDCKIEDIEQLKQNLNLNNVIVLKGIFPDETSKLLKDKKFRLIHLDLDVYESTKDAFNYLWPKLEIGGIVVFDDYGFVGCNGVIDFVNEVKVNEDRIFIHNLNGHAIFIKIK